MAGGIACVIPAGGASSRMEDWKPGLPWLGKPMLMATVMNALAAGLPVVVVAGCRSDDVRAMFAETEGVLVVENPAWAAGMLGSVAVGLEACAGRTGALVLPGDMPMVGPEVIRTMVKAVEESSARGADHPAFPVDSAGKGHPVYIPSGLFAEIAKLDRSLSLKVFLTSIPYGMVPIDDPAIHADIDTKDDYLRYLSEYENA